MTASNTSNGLSQLAGPQLPSFVASNANFQTPQSFAWNRSRNANACNNVVSLAVYRAKKRRAEFATQADARRRRMIGAMATALTIAGMLACSFTLQQERQLNELGNAVEQRR